MGSDTCHFPPTHPLRCSKSGKPRLRPVDPASIKRFPFSLHCDVAELEDCVPIVNDALKRAAYLKRPSWQLRCTVDDACRLHAAAALQLSVNPHGLKRVPVGMQTDHRRQRGDLDPDLRVRVQPAVEKCADPVSSHSWVDREERICHSCSSCSVIQHKELDAKGILSRRVGHGRRRLRCASCCK